MPPTGVLAFHISNRYLDLHRVLGDLAHDAGLFCLANDDCASAKTKREEGKFASWWVVMARNANDLGSAEERPALEGAPGCAGFASLDG